MEAEKGPVSSFTQLKAMIARNFLLKKRLGRKTFAVSLLFKPEFIFNYLLLFCSRYTYNSIVINFLGMYYAPVVLDHSCRNSSPFARPQLQTN